MRFEFIEMESFSVQMLCFIFGYVENKKYDVDMEAQKLFGQNLAAVLAKFRRTSDYVKILTEKASDLQNELIDIRIQIMTHYEKKLNNQIKNMVGLDEKATTNEPTSPAGHVRQYKKKVARRQEIPADEERQKKIDRIDNYEKLSSVLTLKERNEFKDLGFKYVGDVIHMMIEKMGLGEEEVRSTRMPDGGDPQGLRSRTTTEHARDHQVTKEPKTEATATTETTDDKTRRKNDKS